MEARNVESAIRRVRKQLRNYPQSAFLQEGGWRYLEMATRYALIDPILVALGWDLAKPDQCSFEADPKWLSWVRPHADYVLWKEWNEKAAIIIEAKTADKPLGTPEHEAQLGSYIQQIPSGEAVLTNGLEWHIYRINKIVDLARKRPVRSNLIDDDVKRTAEILYQRLNAHQFGW